jgi:hypothetical protein
MEEVGNGAVLGVAHRGGQPCFVYLPDLFPVGNFRPNLLEKQNNKNSPRSPLAFEAR